MFLAADIGNSNITLGVFDGEKLIKTFRLSTSAKIEPDDLKKLLAEFNISGCTIVSVAQEVSSGFKSACDSAFGINSFLCSYYKDFGIDITLPEPEKIGADRLTNAVCAISKYPLPAIVVDIGTAITFDIVSKEKQFLGGIIMPGINLQLKSLNDYTSKLPLVKIDSVKKAIGNNTQNAILSGVIRGIAGAIDGLLKQCEAELGEKATVVLTGGQCEIIAEYLINKPDFINKNLTLEGINKLKKNRD